MILYIVFLVVAIIGWTIVTGNLTLDAFDSRDPQEIKYARLAWLSFFLLPLYPAVVCVALVLGPIMIFRRLGRIGKEEEA